LQLPSPSQPTTQEIPLQEIAPAQASTPVHATTDVAASLTMADLHDDRPEHCRRD
jgi:hypothetical protein